MATITDLFEDYIGAREWDATVSAIQEWYYGNVPRTSWCATSVSYFASQIQIDTGETNPLTALEMMNGKNENVYRMLQSCRSYYIQHSDEGFVAMYDRDNLPDELYRGDILFYLWSGTVMSDNSSKHVSTCYEDTILEDVSTIPSLGGNQNHSIKISYYDKSKLYAVYRIDPFGEIIDPPEPTPAPPSPPEPTPSPESKTKNRIFYSLKPHWRRY